MIGTTPEYLEAQIGALPEATLYAEVRAAGRVALLGQTVATNLFGGEDPVAGLIRVFFCMLEFFPVTTLKIRKIWIAWNEDFY